jgi:glycogen synthase
MPHKREILHCSLEFEKGVGGIKSVLKGLLPALAEQGDFNISIVTPFYDVYNDFYHPIQIARVATVKHVYKGVVHQSIVYRACNKVIDEVTSNKLYHYLIKPIEGSTVAWLFNIKDERQMYQAFPWSEPQNRLEYFNSAVASMLRTPNINIPDFAIVHANTWHAGVGPLAKEFENLANYEDLIQTPFNSLRKIAHHIDTIHMLMSRETGQLTTYDSVKNLLNSLGLPADFARRFPYISNYIREDHLKQVVLALKYSDQVTMVSEGLVNEAISGKGEGLDPFFVELKCQDRLYGIANGITFADFDSTSEKILGEYVFNQSTRSISADKQRIKNHLDSLYPNFDSQKITFVFVGRFAEEKGVDMLPYAAKYINEIGGNFVVFGMHVVYETKDGVKVPKYKAEIDALREYPNVTVIDDPEQQKKVKKIFMGGADVTLVLSHNEACGLPPREGMPFFAFTVAPNIQGLPDTVQCLIKDPNNGTGFLYNDDVSSRQENLGQAILAANKFYLERKSDGTLDQFLGRLYEISKQFDWSVIARKYVALYKSVLLRPVLTYDQVRIVGEIPKVTLSISTPILNEFSTSAAIQPVNRPRIFQLGFNKCGSQSLHRLFCVNEIPAIHYGAGTLASSIFNNHIKGRPLLGDEYQRFVAFFDMENIYDSLGPVYIALSLFKKLDKQYPGSKFILNTRDREKWIKSRSTHGDIANHLNYIAIVGDKYNLTEEQVKERWRQEWDEHHKSVLEYFKDRPNDLLVYDIECEPIAKVCDYFSEQLGLTLKPELYMHINKTMPFGERQPTETLRTDNKRLRLNV